jgi:hypothetical protein
MPIDVRMPDGTLVKNVPDNITQADLLARYNAFSAQPATSVAPEIQVKPQAPQVGPEGAPIPPILQNQEPPIPEQTLLQKIVGDQPDRGPKGPGVKELASDVYAAAKQFPEQLASSAIQAYQGKDVETIADEESTANKIVEDARKSAEANMAIKGAEDIYTDFLGAKIKRSDIRNLPQNLSFSLVAMGSALLSGLGTTAATKNPIAGYGAGAATAGKVAYNIDTNSFLRDLREGLNQASIEQRGIPITNEEFVKIAQSPEMQAKAKEFNLDVRGKGAVDELANIHGLHEAGWEAISSTVGLGAGKYIFKEALKGKILKPVAAFTGELSLELAGETATQLGQSNVERKAGMHQDAERSWSSAEDWKKSYKEVAGPTVLTTALLGGAPAAAGAAKRVFTKATQQPAPQERVEPEVTPPVTPEEAPATPAPVEAVTAAPTKIDTSHDTQAMLDELAGKDIEYIPEEEDKVAEPKPRETIKEFIDRATPEELEEFRQKNAALDMSDEGRRLRAEKEQEQALDEANKILTVLEANKSLAPVEYVQLTEDLKNGDIKSLRDLKDYRKIYDIITKKQAEPEGVITEEEKEFTPVGGRLINKADAARLARESAIALEQNLKNQEIQRDKQIRREIREDKFPAAKTPSLASALKSLGGINQSNKLDMLKDTGKVFNYESAFSKDGEDLLTHIENGSLDEYLPHQLRLSNTPPNEAFDARPAYDYISSVIESKQKVHDYDYELAKIDHENKIREKYLAKQYMEPNEAARVARIEDLDLGPMYEKIKGKPGTNEGVMLDLLSQKLYGNMDNMSQISVKEMVQNAYDSLKPDLDSNKIKTGKIDVTMDQDDRSITVKDNGHGMYPDTLANTFLTIAGSDKESDIASGGLGIAKTQFLFGNKDINVVTMRNGKISELKTTGKQLSEAIRSKDPSQYPDIDIYTPKEYGLDNVARDFPDNQGTIVKVIVPETYTNIDNGQIEKIPFENKEYDHSVLVSSMLRKNIDVTFNGYPSYNVGSSFDFDDYDRALTAKYGWGTIHVYRSKKLKPDYSKFSNVNVLSDGLWQFNDNIFKNPNDPSAGRTPYEYYFDVIPAVKANQPGYPFALNRQSFTAQTQKDLDAIKNYLSVESIKEELTKSSQGFGSVQYVERKNGKIKLSEPQNLSPEIKQKNIKGIDVGSNIEFKNGKMIANGKEVPILTKEDLQNDVDASDLKIDQSKIDPNKTMIHDNLLVNVNKSKVIDNEIDRLNIKMDEAEGILDNMPKYKEGTTEETPQHKRLRKEIDDIYDQILTLERERDSLKSKDEFKAISEVAREEFGDRFDTFMHEIGDVFRTIRDRIVYLNLKGDLPDYNGRSYKALANHAMGVSFDVEYRGVNIVVPFEGMFINPLFPQLKDTPKRAAISIYTTMIHELAHYQVRNHKEEFPSEMQKLQAVLESDDDTDIIGLKNELVKSFDKHKDIFNYLNKLGEQNDSKSIGERFQDGERQRRDGSISQDTVGARRERKTKTELSQSIAKRDKLAQSMQQFEPISSAAQATQNRQIGRPPRNIRGQEVLPQWHGPEESKLDTWLYRLQNKQIDTKRVQELIGDIEEDWNVYEKEQLYHGRTAAGIRNFLLKELLPVIKEIERLKINPEDVRTYLHNRHAEERNIQMNEINPDIYDPKTGRTTPNPLKDKGSGIYTSDAKAYLAGLDQAKKQTLESIAKKFDQIIKGTQQILINSGAESAETIAKWNKTYEYYVPLFRVEDEMARPSGLGGTGQGFAVSGPSSKRAMGSEKDVQDILSNIIAQRERALIRAEKIRVGRALYGLAIQNPNPDFWLPINPDAIRSKKQTIAELRRMGIPDAENVINNLMKEPKERYLKKVNVAEGQIEPEEDFDFDSGLPVNESKEVVAAKINVMARYKDFVFPIRINGKDRYIFFNKNNPRALRMVQSLKNLDVEQLGYLENIFGKFTRWFKNVNTQYNPVFGLVNFLRDMSGTFLNLTSTEIKGKQAQVIAGAYKAMGGILNVHRAERKGKPLPTGPWAKLYQEARDQGFQTGYRDSLIRNQEEMQIIETTLSQFKDGNTKKAFYGILGALTDYNDMMENAFRLSAYKVALDQGLSKQKAAIIAKNLTVNFDKKGAWTSQVNALYAFFNASVQGTERIYQTLKGPKGKLIIGGGILAGMVQAVMLASAGYGDDDPPEFVRERNFIIPLVDGTYLTVPYPLGYNLLPNSGRIVMDFMIRGGRDAGKHMTSLMSAMMNSLNPLGSSGFALQTMMPTAIDPVVALAENKDSFGRPIYRPDRATAPTPGYTRSRDTASTLGKGLAEFLNWASGGTKYQKGSISPTGDEVDFLAGQVGGGLYREISKAGKAIGAQSTGEALAPYQRPIVSRFYGETGSPAAVSQTFYNNVTRMTDHENEIKGRMKNREDVEGYLNDNPEARLWKRANTIENKINELNKRKRMFIERGFPKERIQAVDAQKTLLMQRFNDQVSKLTPE